VVCGFLAAAGFVRRGIWAEPNEYKDMKTLFEEVAILDGLEPSTSKLGILRSIRAELQDRLQKCAVIFI
jgi:hypothetical protein